MCGQNDEVIDLTQARAIVVEVLKPKTGVAVKAELAPKPLPELLLIALALRSAAAEALEGYGLRPLQELLDVGQSHDGPVA